MVAVVATLALLVVRILPMYMEDFAVGSVISALQADPEAPGLANNELRRRISRHLQANGVTAVASGDFNIRRVSGGRELVVDYEIRTPLVFNLDIVGSFRHAATLNTRYE